MSLLSDKNKDQSHLDKKVSIDQVFNLVNNFEYNIENTVDLVNKGKNKISNSSLLQQLKKEKLNLIVEILCKLKNVYINRDEDIKAKLNSLYKSLKEKVNSDLDYILLKIIVEFLKGNDSSGLVKLNHVNKVLFSIILEEIDNSLQDLLTVDNYNNLKDLDNCETEPTIYKIIYSFENIPHQKIDDEKNKKVPSLVYIFFVLTNYTRANFYNELFIVERIIAEYYIMKERKESRKYLLDYLPNSLLESNIKIKIKSFVHLYLIDHNIELNKNLNKLLTEKEYYRNSIDKINEKLLDLIDQNNKKDQLINHLTDEGVEKDKKISILNQELKEVSGRHNYELNLYQTQLERLKEGITSKLKKDLYLEIDGLESIANRIDSNDSESLKIYIANINYILNNLTI